MTNLYEKLPRISVITAVHNAEAFLEPTLRSLLAQTHRNFEAIIVDDGSEDNSIEIVERLASGDSRFRIFRQANKGIAGALNRGIRESRGEFIAFLDHDDLWKPEKLARQLKCIERDDSVGFVGCYSALIKPDGSCLGWRFGTMAAGNVYRDMLFCDLVGGGSVALVRRAAFDQAGLFDPAPEIQGRSDWEQWIRISRLWKFAMVADTLVGYTRSPANYSRDYDHMANAGKAVLDKAAADDPGFDARTRARAQARDTFGIFCMGFADGELDSIGHMLRRSLSQSWRPVLLSPKRLLVVVLFLLARVAPRPLFKGIWNVVSRLVFQLKPGQSFLGTQGP
jgi:glycosyltransferase involved in cell wall biosynthesis